MRQKMMINGNHDAFYCIVNEKCTNTRTHYKCLNFYHSFLMIFTGKKYEFQTKFNFEKKKEKKISQTQAACANINRKHNENGYIFLYRFKQTKKNCHM